MTVFVIEMLNSGFY